jgi:hypothetical protein
VHEQPTLNTVSKDALAAGNVVTDEPGIYIVGYGGIRIEDTVVVKKEGAGFDLPIAVGILTALMVFVLPKFIEVLQGMDAEPPAVTLLFLASARWLLRLQILVLLALLVGAFFYLGGPRVTGWLRLGGNSGVSILDTSRGRYSQGAAHDARSCRRPPCLDSFLRCSMASRRM